MSGSNRGARSKAKLGWIVGAIGIATISSGVGYGLFQQSSYRQEATEQAADYSRHAARQILQSCARLPTREQVQCARDAQPEYDLKARDNRREYDDLVAQRRSALWTFIMGIAALIGMALSALGVILVKQTFDETRRTNLIALRENARATRRTVAAAAESARALEIAQANADAAAAQVRVAEDTAKRQLRAYLTVTDVTVRAVSSKAVHGCVKVSNQGATPARIKRATIIGWIGPKTNVDPISDGPAPKKYWHLRDLLSQGVPDEMTFVNDNAEWIAKVNATDKAELYVYGRIDYEDVFGDPQWLTYAFRNDGWTLESPVTFTACIYGNDGS